MNALTSRAPTYAASIVIHLLHCAVVTSSVGVFKIMSFVDPGVWKDFSDPGFQEVLYPAFHNVSDPSFRKVSYRHPTHWYSRKL